MKFALKLILAEAKESPGRMIPGMLAMCISVALIVWMMGNFDALVREFDDEADAYMGHYSLCVVPGGDNGATGKLVEELRHDPAVGILDRASQKHLPIGKNDKGRSFDDFIRERMGIPSQSPILVGIDAVDCPYELEDGRWPDMKTEQGMLGVLGSASAEFFKVKVGDTLFVRSGARVAEIKVTGIVHQMQAHPDISSSLKQGMGPAFASLFVPQQVFEIITGEPFSPNLLNIQLKEGVDADEFKARWMNDAAFAGASFADTSVVQKRLEDNRSVRRMKDSAQSVAGMVLFACVFIIFTTLSMGVTERTRKLALLRAIGLSKRQVAGLIIGESVLLSVPAFIAGSLGGIAILVLTMPEGISGALPLPSWQTWVLAFLCSVGGGLLASCIPAWRSTRLLPLEATMDHSGAVGKSVKGNAWFMAAAGILCWGTQPLVLCMPGLEPETRKSLFSWLGYPGLLAGTILLAPAIIVLVEKLFGMLAAFLMRLNPAFMRSLLSANLLRTVGTAISLTVGLGLYMAVQIWGYSMVVPFVIDKSMPDTLVSFLHTDFKDAELSEIMGHAPLDGEKMFPIAVEEPDIAREQLESPAFHSIEQKSVVLAGVPVDGMMSAKDAPLSLKFVDGNRDEALEKLKTGRALLIPDTFAKATNLKAGDILHLVSPVDQGNQQWEIAGVVYMPGWHWLTKTSGMRVRRGHFIAALCIADEAQVKSAFNLDSFRFFWGDSNDKRPAKEQEQALQEYLNTSNHDPLLKPMVKVTDSRQLGRRVEGMADRTIDSMSNLPLIALLIGSLALMNTVLASVNARKEEFRLMRAVGVTRGALFRIIVTESLMIGLTTVVLSFLFALTAAWGAIEVLKYGYVFGGVTPPLTIPWSHLFYGIAVTLGLCLVPVIWVGIVKRDAIVKSSTQG